MKQIIKKLIPLILIVVILAGCLVETPATPTPTKLIRASAAIGAEPKATKIPALTIYDVVPSDYYDSPCYIPKGVSLNSYLTEYSWIDPYQADGWDCSQMSAYVEWLVENCGYEANIVIANRIDHVWVDIKIGNKWRPYEATTGSFYFWPEVLNEIYEGRTLTFEDIYEVIDYSNRRFSSGSPSWIYMAINEWAWWKEDPGRD